MGWIVDGFNSASSFFHSLYLECYYAFYIPGPVADFFYSLSRTFSSLAWDFYDFFSWLLTKFEEVGQVLTWDNIYSYFKTYFDAAINAWSWVLNSFWNVWDIADSWWSLTQYTVKGWIAAATQGLDGLIAAWSNFWNVTWPEWTGKLDYLGAAWDNFWAVTLPALVSFSWLDIWWNSRIKDVQGIIESTIKVWFPFYESLAALWNSIEEFFTDPEEWLYKAVDRIFERFW
ncbi:unnamed protein product [marine sediment metagenome]|uniref:Uncharacterized protein n=1 Tax=marine sediment metagenome TaxID=412755 RepID=X1GPG3_9ZZZZ